MINVPLSRRGRRRDMGAWMTVAKRRLGCAGSDFLLERSYVCHLFALRISLSLLSLHTSPPSSHVPS